MKKAIIIISGTPDGKGKFIDVAMKIAWCWNTNSRDFLGGKANSFFWDGVRDENYYKFTSEFLRLVNKYFEFEDKYLKQKIEKFLSDNDEAKEDKEGNKFDKFILIAHGVSKELTSTLKDEYGIYQIHISRRDLNTNIESHDLILYEDDENFESEVTRVISTLAK